MDVMALTPEKRVVDEAIKIDTKVSNIAKMIKIVSSYIERMALSSWHNAKLLGHLYGFGDIYENGKIIKSSRNKCSATDIKKLTKYRMLGYENIYLADDYIVYGLANSAVDITELKRLHKDIGLFLMDCKCNSQKDTIECGGLYITKFKPYYRQTIKTKNYVFALFSEGFELECTDLKNMYFGGCSGINAEIKESECLADIKVCTYCKIKFNGVMNATILVNRCSKCTITLDSCTNCTVKVENSDCILLEHEDCCKLDIVDGGNNQHLGVTDEIINNHE